MISTALDDLIIVAASGDDYQGAFSRACKELREDPASASSPGVAALLAELAAFPGWSGRVRSMRKILTAHRAAARNEPPPVSLDAGGDDLSAIMRSHGYQEAPEGLRVPAGYQIRDGGIWRDDEIVSHRIIAIVGRAVDAETNDSQVTLAWLYAGRWVESTVSRVIAVDARALIQLAGQGAPVDSRTSGAVVAWLREQEHAAAHLPTRASLGRLGWLPGGAGYLLGLESIGADVVLQAPGQGERDHAAAYVVAGTDDAWRSDVWPLVKDYPAGVAVLASFAAPLLMALDAPGWTLDIGGETSIGKTTAARAAASVYGRPTSVVTPWPKTWAAAREAVAFRSFLPTLLDDTKNLSGRWDIGKELVYAAADRISQPLGDPRGGTRRAREVRTILISTGESALISHCGDARGAAARILPLTRSLWPEGMGDVVRSVHPAVARCHGAIGRTWLRYLFTKRALWPAWEQAYRNACDRLTKDAPDEVAARVAQYVAQLQITATLLRSGIGLDVPESLLVIAAELAADGAPQRDTPRLAWEYLQAYGAARPSSWHGADNAREPFIGATGTGWTAWYPEHLRRALEDGGYPPDDVLSSWESRGWLHVPDAGHRTCRVRIDRKDRPRMYKLVHHIVGEDAVPGVG